MLLPVRREVLPMLSGSTGEGTGLNEFLPRAGSSRALYIAFLCFRVSVRLGLGFGLGDVYLQKVVYLFPLS